jgi:hypothetical protein
MMQNLKRDENSGLAWLEPDWPAPAWVRAASTTRLGGFSEAPYDSLNLAEHVGDDKGAINRNRRRVELLLHLPNEPYWLEQVHGCDVLPLTQGCRERQADAAWTDRPSTVCTVMTADCLPVLFCDQAGREVAAAHAGWRGLCEGVLEATIERFSAGPEALMAWLGPAIGPTAFEVGAEVRQAFMAVDATSEQAFQPVAGGKYLADLFSLARMRLQRSGVTAIYGGGVCTYSDSQHFYSYRRDGVTGRMATMIWMGRPSGA